MDGMQYQKPTFTLPASNNASQKQWDFAFLTREEFEEKYGQEEYTKITRLS
jgi:hypothetical protein